MERSLVLLTEGPWVLWFLALTSHPRYSIITANFPSRISILLCIVTCFLTSYHAIMLLTMITTLIFVLSMSLCLIDLDNEHFRNTTNRRPFRRPPAPQCWWLHATFYIRRSGRRPIHHTMLSS